MKGLAVQLACLCLLPFVVWREHTEERRRKLANELLAQPTTRPRIEDEWLFPAPLQLKMGFHVNASCDGEAAEILYLKFCQPVGGRST